MYVKIDKQFNHHEDSETEMSHEVLTPLHKSKPENKVLRFFKNWYILLLTFIIIASISTFGIVYALSKPNSATTASESANSSNNSNQVYEAKPVYVQSPLNGDYMLESKFNAQKSDRVLTVMIENLAGIAGARPQSGLAQADIVYEFPVEGNITRFMGVYWNSGHGTTDDPGVKLMPVRSARKIAIDLSQEYGDPLYMHIGQAESTNPDTNALGALSKYSIKDVSGSGDAFNRDTTCEAKKAVEHCAYSDTATLWNIGKAKGWTTLGTIQPLTYKEDMAVDAAATTSRAAANIKVGFEEDFANYGDTWTYDTATNTYLRNQGTTPHLDAATGKQLSTKTLIIQKTTVTTATNDNLPGEGLKYHKIIKTVGTGDAWIIQDGKAIEATWKKDTLTGRTKYLDRTTGKELSLDRGKMWVTLTSNTPTLS